MKPRRKPSPRYSDVSAPDRSFMCFFSTDPSRSFSQFQHQAVRKYMDAEYVLLSQKRKEILFANDSNEVSIAWLSS